MNEITLKVELAAEDRARIDALISKLDKQADCGLCAKETVTLCAELVRRIAEDEARKTPTTEQPHRDEAQQMLEALMARESTPKTETAPEAPETPQDEPKEPDAKTVDPEPEQPAAPAIDAKALTTSIQPLIIRLTQAGKKDEVRAIVYEYGERVTQIAQDSPEKLPELYERLKALAGEA